ncbi:MAG: 50S ribosomal protein L11 methyltransferase [Oligoflexia bacterium]|nr:50S ribosomal protein L11 methyltransferase [Oligoflexia bacterium]
MRVVIPGGKPADRETFYEWAWKELARHGLAGIHEGTVLSGDAAEQGLETESWTVDAGEAPRERDWVGHQSRVSADFYFETESGAREAVRRLSGIPGLVIAAPEEVPEQDWDAEWKASFLGSANGVSIAPGWRVVPPWLEAGAGKNESGEWLLKINPGAGFGTGTHETTQLCLGAIADCAGLVPGALEGKRVLDFGSGSGILAVGAALLGARVDAIEIDPLAIDNARENARLNGVESRIEYARELPALSRTPAYDIVIANILRPVLLEFSEELLARLRSQGALILSGLIESDVPEVASRYGRLMGAQPEIRSLNEWRGLYWRQRKS